MAMNRYFTLNDGNKIPAIGFGTWQARPQEVERAVEIALRAGYRHIDAAAIYRNEKEVGAGIRNSGVDRKDMFVCPPRSCVAFHVKMHH
jgi:diketogulonate reductase-like aldo/keto reductase